MKIAVTYENGQVFGHFGHCKTFKIFETDGQTVLSAEIVSAIGSGHGALAGFLQRYGVQALICGGIGSGARAALAEAGIQLFPGVTGNVDDAVAALLAGKLNYDPNITCSHHAHECTGSSCGEDHRGCGGNY